MSAEDADNPPEPETQFLQRLDDLGATLWTGGEGFNTECSRPLGWQKLTCEENEARLARFHWHYEPFICVNTGVPVTVVDVDPRNGGEIEKARALLARLKVRIFAEVTTPSGGVHFYIKGHPDLPNVHSTADNQRLPGFPGVDLQSHGCNVFLPATMRTKYGWTPYIIVFDELDQLALLGEDDDGGTGALADWVAEQLAIGVKTKARKTSGGAKEWEWDPCEPWAGGTPDKRQQKYLDAALAGEADKVAKTADGGRNDAIFAAALKLGSYVAGAGVDEQQVIAALEAAAVSNGYTEEDGVMSTRASIRSGLRAGKRNPRAVPPNGSQFFGRSGLLARDLTDAVMRSVTCGFGSPDQRFYTYDSGVWSPGDERIKAEVTRLLGNRYRSAHTNTVLDIIRHSPGTARIADNPLAEYVNVPNGMVAWKTGDLVAHSPDYRSTVQLPVEYDPDAGCPKFEKFIAEVLPPDLYEPTGDSLGFIWELIGYTIHSGNPLHVAVLLHGKGRNGKGTLIRVLKALLGARNCSTVGLHQLVENRFRAATLFGKLANLAGDLDSKWLDNTAMFKAITGNDTIQGEYKYGAAFDFAPWALPFYSINKAFGSADSSEGWVARWIVVPFPTSFIGREDRTLDGKLQSEAELRGILRRGIEALPALMARGRFTEPASLQEAKTAFVVASDAVRAWLNECCVLGAKEWTSRKDLYRAYWNHTVSDGSKTLSAREFYNRIEQVNGIRAATRTGTRGFGGVGLVPPAGAQPRAGAWGGRAQGA